MRSIFRSNNADFVGVSIIVNGNKRSGKMEVTTVWVGKYPLPGFDALMVMPECIYSIFMISQKRSFAPGLDNIGSVPEYLCVDRENPIRSANVIRIRDTGDSRGSGKARRLRYVGVNRQCSVTAAMQSMGCVFAEPVRSLRSMLQGNVSFPVSAQVIASIAPE
jgi:hypothetical protein